MKIDYVLAHPSYFAEGPRGRVAHAAGIADGLADAGAEVTVISGLGAERFVGVPSISLGAGQTSYHLFLWRLARSLRARRLTTDAIIVRYAMATSPLVAQLLRLFQVPFYWEVNSLTEHQQPGGLLERLLFKALSRLEEPTLQLATGCIVVSEALKDSVLTRGVPARDILVLPNGGARILNQNALLRSPLKLVFLGRLQDYYDIDGLVNEVKRLRRLESFGSSEAHIFGGDVSGSTAQFESDPANGIYFYGEYDRAALLAQEDLTEWVLVLPFGPHPSDTIGSPIKLFEYMSLGRPIIARSVGQVAELVNDDMAYLYHEVPGRARFRSIGEAFGHIVADSAGASSRARRCLEVFLKQHTWKARGVTLIKWLNR